MSILELLQLNYRLLKTLSDNGIKLEDYKYVELFSDYQSMVQKGDKISYIVSILSQKYSVNERTLYRILKRFKNYCQTLSIDFQAI